MPGTKVEHLSPTNIPKRTASKLLTSFPSLLEDHFVWLGNKKWFVEHFRLRDLEPIGDSFSNRMILEQGDHMAGFTVTSIGWKTADGQVNRNFSRPSSWLISAWRRWPHQTKTPQSSMTSSDSPFSGSSKATERTERLEN